MAISTSIAAVAAIASAGSSIYSNVQQGKRADKAAADALASAPNPAADQIKADNAARDAGAAQRRKSAGAQGYQSTILTSPQGVTTPAPGAQKTLLGQ